MENVINLILVLQGAIVIGTALGMIPFYIIHHPSKRHIAAVSTSYVLISTAIILHFLLPELKYTIIILTSVGFLLGDYSLWRIWRDRYRIKNSG